MGIVCRMFDIMLDNNLKCCRIIFEMIVDYVAEGFDIMFGYYVEGVETL